MKRRRKSWSERVEDELRRHDRAVAHLAERHSYEVGATLPDELYAIERVHDELHRRGDRHNAPGRTGTEGVTR